MNNLWILFAVLSGFADIGYNYFTRKALKDRIGVSEFSWWMTAIRSVIFLPALFQLKNLVLNSQQILILLSLAIVTLINIQLFMKMHSRAELSLSTIIVRLRLVWVPLIAFFLINERLTNLNYAGILVIFAAVLVVSSPKKLVVDKAVNSAFIFSITTSVLTVIQKAAAAFAPTSLIVLTMSLPTVLILPFLVKNPKKEIFSGWNKNVVDKLQIALFGILVAYFFVKALNLGAGAGAAGAIYQGMSVLAIAVGIFVLKETDQILKKILAGILTLIGVLLLI